MPTTRMQVSSQPDESASQQVEPVENANQTSLDDWVESGEKHLLQEGKNDEEKKEKEDEEPPAKRTKVTQGPRSKASPQIKRKAPRTMQTSRHVGKPVEKPEHEAATTTIERGHIYFFYRPRVEHKEAHSMDDVQSLHMLLLPRPPVSDKKIDAVPGTEALDKEKKDYRLIRVGKKRLPEPSEQGSQGQAFWACVASVGDDLNALEKTLGESTYETATLGTRHEEPSRILGRGAYAIVLNEGRVPSDRSTLLGYHLSHPTELGDVHKEFGIHSASSFALQVKNPLAPYTGPGLPAGEKARYSEELMSSVFGAGTKGKETYGLKFAPCEKSELLDQAGTELLLIASKKGDEGLEESLGDGKGEALRKAGETESDLSTAEIYRELAMDAEDFPAEPLEGKWI